LGYLDPYNANLDKGNADYDIRNRFVVSGTWNLPWGNNMSNKVETAILGGWSFSPIIVVHSGYPYSIYDCTNLGATGYTCPRWIPTQPVNQNGNVGNTNLSAAGPNLFNYLQLPIDSSTGLPVGDGNALAVPTCAQLDHGQCVYSGDGLPQGHRNAFTGPNWWNFNFVIGKTFKLTERFNLQFRGEFYNAFNHSNYYITTGNLDIEDGTGVTAIQAEKGIPYQAGAPAERRNIQLGLKLNF
jgi:hypothetical protein